MVIYCVVDTTSIILIVISYNANFMITNITRNTHKRLLLRSVSQI